MSEDEVIGYCRQHDANIYRDFGCPFCKQLVREMFEETKVPTPTTNPKEV